ncbi:MAG: hypothetical protein GY798_00230 [Hyphomicrobiales bacterium]|nr:hypothetical protein [Hyphomicrobiales bacterium]
MVKVHGSPYQRGLQHGRACGDLIARYPDVLLEVLSFEARLRAIEVTSLPTRDELLGRAMRFLPALEAFASHLVEEVRGIAEGAKLPFAEVLLVNVRAEVMGTVPVENLCTAFAVGPSATADGSVLSGQNLDQHPLNRNLMIVLHVEPDDGPAILMGTFAGLVGYPGINADGLSLFQNALSTTVWRTGAMPHYFLKRVFLEQSNLRQCLAVARKADVCSSSNYIVTDREGTLRDLEMTPDTMAVLEPDDDFLVHANHFRSRNLIPEEALLSALPDSAGRVLRLEELLASRSGRITIDDLKTFLADHEGSPTGICRHEAHAQTISSMIAEPEHGRLHIANGHACTSDFVTYSL